MNPFFLRKCIGLLIQILRHIPLIITKMLKCLPSVCQFSSMLKHRLICLPLHNYLTGLMGYFLEILITIYSCWCFSNAHIENYFTAKFFSVSIILLVLFTASSVFVLSLYHNAIVRHSIPSCLTSRKFYRASAVICFRDKIDKASIYFKAFYKQSTCMWDHWSAEVIVSEVDYIS